MELTLKYEKEDWNKFQLYLERNLCKSTKGWYESVWFNIVSWLIISFVFFTYFQGDNEFNWKTAGIVIFFCAYVFAQFLLSGIKFKKACSPSKDGGFIGEHTFNFNESTIGSEGVGYSATHKWEVVKRSVRTEDAIYLFLDNALAFIFPISQIEDPDKFYEYVNSKITTG